MFDLRRKVGALETDQADTKRTLILHVEQCEKRGARLEKLAWWALGIGIAVLGMLLKTQLHLSI